MSRIGGGSPRSSVARWTRSSRSRYSTPCSLAKAFERFGVRFHNPSGSSGDSVAVLAVGDVAPHRPTGRLLHRDALGGGAFAQRHLFVFGQSQRHGHELWYHSDTELRPENVPEAIRVVAPFGVERV